MTSRKSLVVALAFLISLTTFVSGAARENSAGKYAGVKVWYGTYSIKVAGKGSHASYHHYELDAGVTGTFTLTQNAKHPNWWDGKIQNQAHVRYKATMKPGNCEEVETIDGAGPTTDQNPLSPEPDSGSSDPEIRLSIYRDTWDIHITKIMLPAVLTITGCGLSTKLNCAAGFFSDTGEIPIPASGADLHAEFVSPSPLIIPAAGGHPDLPMEVEFHLSPTPDELILEIDPEDYANWRPSADPTGKPGNALSVVANLKRKSGALAGIDVERIEWELVDTSRVPGIAINYPVHALDSDVDMRFEPQAGQKSLDKDHQQLTTRPVKNGIDMVKILSFDWGGWSTLHVTAFLKDGQKVVGKLKDKGDEDILLPKRRQGSLIADAWRDEHPKATGADDYDDEKDKVRGGLAGDGLTLYEEYRGFYAKGVHYGDSSTDPMKRDLFVLDETNGAVEGGIKKFEKESGIIVHRLRRDEMDPTDRIVNANHQACPHVVNQHGIRIVWIEATPHKVGAGGNFIATYPAGALSPGGVEYILVPHDFPTEPLAGDGTPYNDVSFAHEMMHAVGVRHHGTGDKSVFWKTVRSEQHGAEVFEYATDEKGHLDLEAGGQNIEILNIDHKNVTAAWIERHKGHTNDFGDEGQAQEVGVRQGEHSGDLTCMMRYDRCGAYQPNLQSAVRILIPSAGNPGAEPVGYTICHDKDGAPPNSRFGPAQKGNCAAQMRVSDLITLGNAVPDAASP